MAARGAAVIAICGAGVSCGEDSRGGYPPSDLVSVLGSPAMPAGSPALETLALVKPVPFSDPFRPARDSPVLAWHPAGRRWLHEGVNRGIFSGPLCGCRLINTIPRKLTRLSKKIDQWTDCPWTHKRWCCSPKLWKPGI